VGFVSMCISIPRKGEKANATSGEMRLVERCKMHYLNLGYNVILDSRFTFCCLCKTHHSISKIHVSYNSCTLYEYCIRTKYRCKSLVNFLEHQEDV
jgi:hypothetical protein